VTDHACLCAAFNAVRFNTLRTFIFGLACMAVLARDAFVRTTRRAIAMMFVRLTGAGLHCDHTVLQRRFKFTIEYSNLLGTLTPEHVHLLLALSSESAFPSQSRS